MATDSGAMQQFPQGSADVKDIKESTEAGKPTSNTTVLNELGLGQAIRDGFLFFLESYKKELEEQKIRGELAEIIDTFLNEQASDEIIKKRTQDLKNIYTNLQGTVRQIATHIIAVFYIGGLGGITDSKEMHEIGMKLLEALDKENFAPATASMGYCFYYGYGGLKKDSNKAFKFLHRAADMNYTNAMLGLAEILEEGEECKPDLAKSLEWYKRAAEMGNVSAMLTLANLYDLGRGVEKDSTQAFKWLQHAAELGDVSAMCTVGLRFQNGQGTAQNLTKAGEWFKRANSGNLLSQLGAVYKWGLDGVKQDLIKAREMYEQAAALGDSLSMLELGNYSLNGYGGVTQDDKTASEWFARAAELGSSVAMSKFAWCLQFEIGTTQDNKTAFEWYERAAKSGNVNGVLNLAISHLNGQGIAIDPKIAYEYCQLASDLNDYIAKDILGFALRQIWSELNCSSNQQHSTEIKRDQLLAKQLSQDITLKKDIEDLLSQLDSKMRDEQCQANSTLGFCHLRGLGVEQDFAKALTYFIRGWKLGARYCLLDIWYVLQHHTKIASELISIEQIKGYCEKWIEEETDAIKKAHACILMAEILQSAHYNQMFLSAKYLLMALSGVNNHLPLTQTAVTRGEKVVNLFQIDAVSQSTPLPLTLCSIIGAYAQERVNMVLRTPIVTLTQKGGYTIHQNNLDQKQSAEELETMNNQVLILSGKLNAVVKAVSSPDAQEKTDVKDNKDASKNVGSSKQG